MTELFTFSYRSEPNLHFPNFTNLSAMEDKKNSNNPKGLEDLKKELTVVNPHDAISLKGGKTLDKDKWGSGCNGIVPQ